MPCKVTDASVIYKHDEDFVLARDSSYVENFINAMNIFLTKVSAPVHSKFITDISKATLLLFYLF